MSILNLNDIIENDDNLKFKLNDKEYTINANLDSVLAYEKLLNEYKDKKISTEEFGNQVLKIILGNGYEQFQNELKNTIKSTKQVDRILMIILKKWMEEIGWNKEMVGESEKK